MWSVDNMCQGCIDITFLPVGCMYQEMTVSQKLKSANVYNY